MELTKPQVKFLRSLAHDRKPVIWLGQNGLTDSVSSEIETALDYHELIKIKLRVGDRDLRDKTIEELCGKTRAEVVQRIGNIVTIYRKNRKHPGIVLPK
ncbi:MAG: RNA-binding protein [Gammaproteobacteria bacterium RIFCSPLOWO2_12_47_11]|jgi:RNA-binding protein|nr:MAG: RNA-binding protein [Gammaproteobacteria bacterium RIFCSPLOWO2_12_47_11]